MPKRNAERKAARKLQLAEGLGYQEALRRVRAQPAPEATAEEAPAPDAGAVVYVLQPTAVEADEGITAEELGIRALPADATASLRAHAEAVWSPAPDGEPCRCSGTGCRHGEPCTEEYTDGTGLRLITCDGTMIHSDRHPGSLWGLTEWWDSYSCPVCGEGFGVSVELPDIPWGELRQREGGGTTTVVYDGVRHPNFGVDEEGDGEGELDPDDYPVPGDDFYGDEGQEDEEPPDEEGQEGGPAPLDDGSQDYDDPIGGPDEDELAPPARVLAVDHDPQPTATDWAAVEARPW
ncbi:hypothetical protein ACFQ7F_43600 [Streptomyces sp. NPDC056486]|uniref:hypothetical protein n=1 Tax=Streptomyces sp. NPDC056486 TaxID=3345835 RepID=UPI003695357E